MKRYTSSRAVMFFTREANDSERVNISSFKRVELKETRICKNKSFDAFESGTGRTGGSED